MIDYDTAIPEFIALLLVISAITMILIYVAARAEDRR